MQQLKTDVKKMGSKEVFPKNVVKSVLVDAYTACQMKENNVKPSNKSSRKEREEKEKETLNKV